MIGTTNSKYRKTGRKWTWDGHASTHTEHIPHTFALQSNSEVAGLKNVYAIQLRDAGLSHLRLDAKREFKHLTTEHLKLQLRCTLWPVTSTLFQGRSSADRGRMQLQLKHGFCHIHNKQYIVPILRQNHTVQCTTLWFCWTFSALKAQKDIASYSGLILHCHFSSKPEGSCIHNKSRPEC